MKVYALVHRTCKHVGGIENGRAMLERQKDLLFRWGYRQWRIEAMNDEEAARRLLASPQGCETCAVVLPTTGGAA